MMPTTNSSTPLLKISPAMTSDAMPIRIVSSQPIGSTPGWNRRPSAPTTAPTMINQIQCMIVWVPGPSSTKPLRPALELRLLGFEFLVRQDAGVVKVAQLAEVCVGVTRGMGALRLSHQVLHFPTPVLEAIDPDATLGKLHRFGSGERALLDEPP